MSRSATPYLTLLLLGTVARCCAQQTAATYVPSWAPFWARPLYSAQLQLELAEMQRDDQKVRLAALPCTPMAASSVSSGDATPAGAQRSAAQPPLVRSHSISRWSDADPSMPPQSTSPPTCYLSQGGVDLIVLGDSMTEVLRGTMLSLPCNETDLRLDCKRCVQGIV